MKRLQSLKHWISGYVIIELKSDHVERFLNLCAKQNIEIWNLKKNHGHNVCYMMKDGLKRSETLRKKTNTDIKVIRKAGLPFFLCQYCKRKLLLCGMFLCLFLLFGLSQFVWEIDVSGNISYTKEDIIKYVDEEFIPLGTLKMKVDCADLEEQLRLHYDEIAWVSCSLHGCRLSINIKETLDKNTKNNASKPCDLVASKNGVITSIVTQNGTPLVQKGDKVKKGDTLITGNIYIYSDSNEVLETHKEIAEGTIWAKTRAAYECSFLRSYYKKEYKNKKSYTYAAYLCGKRVPLMPEIKQEEGMDQITEKIPLKIGKTFFLPFYLERTITRRFETVKMEYGKQEAYKEAQNRIEKKIREFEEKGIRVLSDNIEISVNDIKCEAKGYFILEEPIGKIRSIRDLTKEQEEKLKPTEEVAW